MSVAKSKETVLSQIFFLFIFPLFLLQFGLIPVGFRMLVLLFACVLIYGIIRHESWTQEEIGIDDKGFLDGLVPYTIFTVIGVAGIVYLAHIAGFSIQEKWWMKEHFWLVFLPISALQEIAYRGFLMPKLRVVYSKKTLVIVSNAFLFMLLHSMYPRPEVMLPLTFIGGAVFAFLYDRYPNLVLISISHAVLNFAAVLYGFFSFLN